MSTVVPKSAGVRGLDKAREPDAQITEEQAKDPKNVALVFMDLLRDVASLKRRFWPKWVDFEDLSFDASGLQKFRLTHNLNARVRWWPVDVTYGSSPSLKQHEDTDLNTLVLVSYLSCTATIRVEAAG